MIICRKCQKHHPDDVGAGPCTCGADLRRDGIALVLPPATSAPEQLDEYLPPIELSTESTETTEITAANPLVGRVVTPTEPPGVTEDRSTRGEGVDPAATASPEVAEPVRRARSLSPRDLVESRKDPDAANVGAPRAEGPAAVAEGAGAEDAEPQRRVPRHDELVCSACTEPNPLSRRFCLSCGTPLPAFDRSDVVGGEEEDEREPRDTVWRKLTGTGIRGGQDRRTWRQKARDAGQRRLSYHAGYSMRSKVLAVLAVAGIGGGAIGLAGPGRAQVRDLLGGSSPPGTSPASAELVDAEEEIAGFPVADIADNDERTGAAVRFDPDEGIPLVTIRLTLEEPTTVTKLHIAPGLPDGAVDGPLVRRPSRLRVCSESGSCQELELEDSTSLQARGVSLGEDLLIIELTVLEVHDTDVTTYPLAVIGEVRVES